VTKARFPEVIVQVLILLLVAGMAGAASFTHVHDWTMRHVPPGTGSWFGWANAVITELVPLACGLEVRRRKHANCSATYPMVILITDGAVSLTIQLSDAIHDLAGSLAVALPALAFLALTKLILSRPRALGADGNEGQHPCATTAYSAGVPGQTAGTALAPATTSPATSAPPAGNSTSTPMAAPAAGTLTRDSLRDLKPIPSGQLIMSARMTAFDHLKETGHPITPGELADRLGVPLTLAASLLDHSGTTSAPLVTAVNGTSRSEGAGQP
jgi:hypothetical protein